MTRAELHAKLIDLLAKHAELEAAIKRAYALLEGWDAADAECQAELRAIRAELESAKRFAEGGGEAAN